jgi:hypothetical protein
MWLLKWFWYNCISYSQCAKRLDHYKKNGDWRCSTYCLKSSYHFGKHSDTHGEEW